MHQPAISDENTRPKGRDEMDQTHQDRFAYEAFILAFRIQKILESDLIPQEAKEALADDWTRLKEKVTLLTKFREDREPAERLRHQLGPFFKPF